MTLILTVANARGVHQCSDYRLTDQQTGAPVSDITGSKQLEVGFRGLHLQIAFTGVASVGKGAAARRTTDWLLAELEALPWKSSIQEICDALRKRATVEMKPHGPRGVLTLILAVASYGNPFRVVEISNARWGEKPPTAKGHFHISSDQIVKPRAFISGYRDCVSDHERQRLNALARAVDRPPEKIREELAAINAAAARNSHGYVSDECWVSSQLADGEDRRFVAQDIGGQSGMVPQLSAGFDMLSFIKDNFQIEPGREIRPVQLGGVMGRGVPMPPPDGEPREFIIDGSSATLPLCAPSGQQCASIDIAQLNCRIITRRNADVTVPIARVHLRSTAKSTDFQKPRWPWPFLAPELRIDDAVVPRGWEYSIGYWVEAGVHRVVIQQSSRSVRKLAFLGDDDELVIVAPSSQAEFSWPLDGEGSVGVLEGRISWRIRPDGTRG
jgi:hypothetical protein